MRFNESIQQLKEQLQTLGFENGLEFQLRSKICFQPERFVLQFRLVKDTDVIDFLLHFDITDEKTGYRCRFYDATLRKKIPIKDNIINEVSILVLDNLMNLIDWNISTPGDIGREDAIDTIISDLKKLERTEEGKNVSQILKFKYWTGTNVEDMISSLSMLKSRYEINQRFYFFEGEGQITIEEAYRFLCNKWLEKQLQVRKKQQDQPASSDTGGSGETGLLKKVKLLPKKKRGRGVK